MEVTAEDRYNIIRSTKIHCVNKMKFTWQQVVRVRISNRSSLQGRTLIQLTKSHQRARRNNLVVWPHLQNIQRATKHTTQYTRSEQHALNATNTVATHRHNVSSRNEADMLTCHMSHRAKSCYGFHKLAPGGACGRLAQWNMKLFSEHTQRHSLHYLGSIAPRRAVQQLRNAWDCC